MSGSVWSRLYKFWEVYEYHGYFDESGKSSRKLVSFNGRDGVPHSDGGFRLRSTLGGGLSFSDLPLGNLLVGSRLEPRRRRCSGMVVGG